MSAKLAPNHERLQSLLDGELDEASRAELAEELERDPALAAELERLRQVRGLLFAAPAALDATPSDPAAFDRILGRIHAELDGAAPARPVAPANVVPIDAARKRRRTLVGAAVAFAAAAAVAVVSLAPSQRPGTEVAGTGSGGRRTGAVPAGVNGTEIVRVEFGKSSGTFWEQSDGADRVAIVWIDDTMPSEVARP